MTDRGVGRYALISADVIGIAIHHSVTAGTFYMGASITELDELAHLEMIDRYHASLGWGGFGYHLAAFPSGRLFLCGNLNGARAHVASRNHELVGLVLIGTFTATAPGPRQLSAAAEGVAFMRRIYPERPIGPHRYWALPEYPTSCPGDTWLTWMHWLDVPLPEEDDMKLLNGDPSGRVFVVGESGKRYIDDDAEVAGYTAAGYGLVTVPDAQIDNIPDAPQPLRLLTGQPSGRVYVLGSAGKRYIDDPAEMAAYQAAGWSIRPIDDAALFVIPNAGS